MMMKYCSYLVTDKATRTPLVFYTELMPLLRWFDEQDEDITAVYRLYEVHFNEPDEAVKEVDLHEFVEEFM